MVGRLTRIDVSTIARAGDGKTMSSGASVVVSRSISTHTALMGTGGASDSSARRRSVPGRSRISHSKLSSLISGSCPWFRSSGPSRNTELVALLRPDTVPVSVRVSVPFPSSLKWIAPSIAPVTPKMLVAV